MPIKINYVMLADKILGSFRYQVLVPATELRKRGYEIVFSFIPAENCDVHVFYKHFREEEKEMLLSCKNRAKKTVFIVSDLHFETKHENHYRFMISHADKVVTATNLCANVIKDETGVDATVIYDPWGTEFEEQPPRFSPHGNLKLFWFGHKSNINPLLDCAARIDGVQLAVSTSHDVKGIKLANSEIENNPYSIPAMKSGFSSCDAVILPQNIKRIPKRAKTHNRIVDAFRSGRFVICSPVDSYLDFKEWAYIGDVVEGVQWLEKQKPEDIEKRISEAQKYIRKNFNPEVITDQWETVLSN